MKSKEELFRIGLFMTAEEIGLVKLSWYFMKKLLQQDFLHSDELTTVRVLEWGWSKSTDQVLYVGLLLQVLNSDYPIRIFEYQA